MDWQQLLNSERPRKTSSSGDHRLQFERDLDRCVFSTPVKRLQDKAQVFPLEEHDAVRTRLTHSLEVSSVARGLAVAVSKWLADNDELVPRTNETVYDMQRSIEAIGATAGLIHDLGNPPFGHAGEEAIREWFLGRFKGIDPDTKKTKLETLLPNEQQRQDLLQFEGNAQTLRLVAKLQVLADFNGLNLTWGTLSALCKYTASSTEVDKNSKSRKKPGYFYSENELISRIREKTGTGAARNPITFLVEAADDIVYSVADVEDAVKKGVLSWKQLEMLLRESPEVSRLDEVMERKGKILESGSIAVDQLPDDVHASAFRTAAIGVMVDAAIETFKEHYESIKNGTYDGALIDDSSAKHLSARLTGDIGAQYVYTTASTLKLELMGRRVIKDLLDVFWEGARMLPLDEPPKAKDFPGKAGALLSNNYRRVFQQAVKENPADEPYARFQLVTDYICGMTDTFCKSLHTELFNG
jgi:dGTPase